jgi:hypothetical protein
MKLFDAIGYAHAECGRIVGIRNGKKRWVSYDLLEAGEVPPGLSDDDFIGDGWEIGGERFDEETGGLYIEMESEY